MTLLKVFAITAAVAIGGPAVAQGPHFHLSGNQEVPSISTAGNGIIEFVSAGGGVVDYTLTYQDLEGAVLQAHIHFAQRGVIGGIAVWLCTNLGNGPEGTPLCPDSPGVVNGSFDASDIQAIVAQGLPAGDLNALIAARNDGLLYANVHTDSFLVGEIRVQLDVVT